MREPTYYLLLALAEEPRHGYGAAKRAEELSNGTVRITAGTLYGALERLEAGGSIELDCEEVVRGRTRRYYRITDSGRGELADEVLHLRAAVAAHDRIEGCMLRL